MGDIKNPLGKDIIKLETQFCGRTLSMEVNRMAFQSSSVIVQYGDTVVQGTALADDRPSDRDYFPLMIDYEEKMYAAGKISGSRFVKREGRPSEDAVLASRLIDRPIRPLFPKGYHHEVQGVASVYSQDPELAADIVAMAAISAAISLTGAPFDGPVAGVRMGLVDDKLVAFPTTEQMENSKLDLIVAGTEDAIMMVEAGADEVTEEVMADALAKAHEAMQPVIKLQQDLIKKVGVEEQEYETEQDSHDLKEEIDAFIEKSKPGLTNKDTDAREAEVKTLRERTVEHFANVDGDEDSDKPSTSEVSEVFAHLMKQVVRDGILNDGVRPDERKPEDVRELSSQVGVMPRTHGSSIFTRGLTQALNITTLAPTSYAQMFDTMTRHDEEDNFFHHYNFPAWSVGEIRPIRGPGRREIGHGALAERALRPVIPSTEDFPYTIRTVSEIQSSAGSTSMASVCSATLSMMDAGVPLKRPVSGIAMGLMKDGDKEVILTDIMDQEDFAGDMDFKVAGTSEGITALQMDIKVKGLSSETLAKALKQAKEGRDVILKHMLSVIAEPRKEMSPYAPRIDSITIPEDKIRDVIGKGGETINKIIDETGVEIDIKDDGTVMISAVDQESRDAAIKWVKDLTAEPEIGATYDATVVKVMDFGVFVEFMPGHEGLVHVSEMADHHVKHPSDLVQEGDTGPVKLLEKDSQGRYNLSIKQANT